MLCKMSMPNCIFRYEIIPYLTSYEIWSLRHTSQAFLYAFGDIKIMYYCNIQTIPRDVINNDNITLLQAWMYHHEISNPFHGNVSWLYYFLTDIVKFADSNITQQGMNVLKKLLSYTPNDDLDIRVSTILMNEYQLLSIYTDIKKNPSISYLKATFDGLVSKNLRFTIWLKRVMDEKSIPQTSKVQLIKYIEGKNPSIILSHYKPV